MTLVLGLAHPQLSIAQLPQNRIDWIFPNGLQRGTSTEIQISGVDLEGLTSLRFSHRGLTAKPSKDGRWTVSSEAGIQPGVYAMQAIGNWGISNPIPIMVGPLPEIRETEPNEKTPQLLKIPVTVSGQIQAAADVDNFNFTGKKGDRVVIEAKSDSYESPLDPTIRVFGPSGSQVAESQDTTNYDPYLELSLPEDGTYRLQLFDAVYGGSPAHIYRLSIHNGPVIDSVIPASVNAVEPTSLKLLGRGLSARAEATFPKLNGFAESSLSMLFDPKSATPPNSSLGVFSNSDSVSRYNISQFRGQFLIDSKPLAIATEPVQSEIESNDVPKQAQQLIPPFDLTGLIQQPGDVDYYHFSAKQDEIWVIETVADRLNSPAYLNVTVEKLNPDNTTSVVAELAEMGANPFGPIFEKATRDGKLQWKAPSHGDYVLRVVHSNSHEGDARFVYRLIMRKLKPDFQLIAIPAGATGPTGLTCIKGGRTVVSVLLNRMDGFDSAVRVDCLDLPAGMKCYPAIFAAGQSLTSLILEADPTAATTEFALKLRGETSWADRKDATDWLPGQPRETSFSSNRSSVGGGLVRPLVGQANQQRGISRYSESLMVAVRQTPVPYQLEPEPLRLFAKRGTTVDLPVQVIKFHGFDAPIALKLENMPAQMEAVAGTIEKGKATVTLKCKIGANIALGRHTVYVSGAAPFGFAKDPAAKERPNINWNIPSRPLTLVVTP